MVSFAKFVVARSCIEGARTNEVAHDLRGGSAEGTGGINGSWVFAW